MSQPLDRAWSCGRETRRPRPSASSLRRYPLRRAGRSADGADARLAARGLLPAVFLAALLVWAAWPWLPFSRAATPPPHDRLLRLQHPRRTSERGRSFPAFQKTLAAERTASGSSSSSSFAGSGTVTNQIIMGVPAQLALLSLESDADRLADAGVVAARELAGGCRTAASSTGRPSSSSCGRAIRRASATSRTSTRPGVGVVHPDPLTSGGANWAIVAEYGAGARGAPGGPGGGRAPARRHLEERRRAGGLGARGADAVRERLRRRAHHLRAGGALRPGPRAAQGRRRLSPRARSSPSTRSCVVDRNIRPTRAAARRRASCASSGARRRSGSSSQYGFRSVDETLNAGNPAFGTIADPFRIADFGGWQRAQARDRGRRSGRIAS